MAKDYNQLALDIINKVGGESNVISLAHCVTRLRFKLVDESKADTDGLNKTAGVMRVMPAGGQYQVIIGNDVTNVYDAILKASHIKYKIPMIIVCLVNGIGGAICGIFNVTRDVQMSVNLLTIPAVWAVYGPWAIVAIAVSMIGCFVLTWTIGYNDKMQAQ